MLTLDPLAVRVAARHLAQVRAERIAIEYQRRMSEGLVAVGEDEDEDVEAAHLDEARRSARARPPFTSRRGA